LRSRKSNTGPRLIRSQKRSSSLLHRETTPRRVGCLRRSSKRPAITEN
jgi:hypothetical protein